jgi:endonuclease/exonuclease/phosphatase family metal-dependent hydrolase
MPAIYRSFAKRFIIILHSATVIIFLFACLAPYLHPSQWWFINMMGLGFALVFILLLLFILFWIIVKPRYALISLIPLIIGWKSISVFFAVNVPEKFNYNKSKESLRVASWNVARFTEWRRNNNKGSKTRLKMMELIKEQNADVLCLQEFFHSTDTIYYNNLDYISKDLGYPYYYFSWEGDGDLQWVGQAIFSRFPIIDSGVVHYPRPGLPETLLQADILFNHDTIRFYTTHLQSVQFRKEDYRRIDEITNQRDSLLENSKNIFSKLRRALLYRTRQADIAREITGNSPYPYVFAGDFNDVPNSYTYFTIRNDLQDAFLKKGFGIGRTYSALSPTLRIDYILATKEFSIEQFNRIIKNYSDHYLLVADVKLP